MSDWTWDDLLRPGAEDLRGDAGHAGPGRRSAADPALPRTLLPQRLETDADAVAKDLLKLVLTIIELIRRLMEKQALRRVDEGDLTDEQVEGLGQGLMHLEEAMDELKERYGLTAEDLNLDLGPLGALL